MKKVTVIFGRTENNYSAYVEGLDGFVCASETFEELKKDVAEGIEFHLDGLREDNDPIPEVFRGEYELEFKWDVQCLMYYYNHVITRSALSRFTGINERQLGNYATGRTKPRPAQVQKIMKAFHSLGNELASINL
ncbi:MAG: type II toxin-antitoxin system HicB family antitoxin [Prolixibacteraceae bacterium]|nr:type II toxin-antitoxin system HicB family antitoxin [Prolixibacteraceae bacterium]